MKKILYLMVLAAALAGAGIEVSNTCQTLRCIEGDQVTFTVEIFNNLGRNITISRPFVINDQFEVLGATTRTLTLAPNQTAVVNMTQTLFLPLDGYTHRYHACMNVSDGVSQKIVCSSTIKTLTVTPSDRVQCRTDDECLATESCHVTRNTCMALNCSYDEAVVDHACLALSCPQGYTPYNHTCLTPSKGSNMQVIYAFVVVLLLLIVIAFFALRPEKKTRRRRR